MAARTVVETIAGATISISASLPATYDAAGYQSTDIIWALIGEIEDHGTHGVKGTIVEFTPVDTAIVTKMKGSKNYGSKTLTLGAVASDAGQVMLEAASESNNHYSLKVIYPDGDVHYLDAIIADFESVDGTVNSVQKVSCMAAICRKPVKVLAP